MEELPTSSTGPAGASEGAAGSAVRQALDRPPDAAQQLQFAYKILDDNQGVIRALDAKTAFAVALLSAMVGKVLSDLRLYFPWVQLPMWLQCLLLAFGFVSFVAALLIGRVLFPTSNPIKNIRIMPGARPAFYLCEFDPKSWRRYFSNDPKFSRLKQEHLTYWNALCAGDAQKLLETMTAEVLKVSYIREIKMQRFKLLTYVLVICAGLYAALMGANTTIPATEKPVMVRIQNPVAIGAPASSGLKSSPPALPQHSNRSAKTARRSSP